MPPKNKKQQEEEAKRLQAQRLKQQQQQRLLQIEKAKYASTQISTGLTLPVTSLLIEQFSIKPQSFVKQKLVQYLQTVCPDINSNPTLLKVVLNQLLSNIIFVIQNFCLTHKDEVIRTQNYEKSKVFIGIMMEVFINNNPSFKSQNTEDILQNNKSKQNDWSLFKSLILKHSYDEPPTRIKYFDKQKVKMIIQFAEKGYFGHHNLLMKFNQFKKKQEIKKQIIYIDRPQIFMNTKLTPFIDLRPVKEETNNANLIQENKADISS